jgi:putative ABC transport system ATP-binding protein
MEVFTQLNKGKNITMVMVTHEPDIACFAGKRIYIRDGEIIKEESNGEGCEDFAGKESRP